MLPKCRSVWAASGKRHAADRAKADPIDGVLTALDKLSLADLEAIASLVDEMIDARLAA